MSKGLESLEKIWDTKTFYFQDYVEIRKELKALEIIKTKYVDIEKEIYYTKDYTEYVMKFGLGDYNLTQQEFILLKGVLDNV